MWSLTLQCNLQRSSSRCISCSAMLVAGLIKLKLHRRPSLLHSQSKQLRVRLQNLLMYSYCQRLHPFPDGAKKIANTSVTNLWQQLCSVCF